MAKLITRFSKVIRNLYSLDCCRKSLHRLTGRDSNPKIAHYHQVCFCSGSLVKYERCMLAWMIPGAILATPVIKLSQV